MLFRLVLASFLATTGMLTPALAADIPVATPEEMGFSSERLNRIDAFYDNKVKNGEIAGIVVLIARHGKIVHESAIGYANVETRQRMTKNTLFRIFSMTKPITAVALLHFYEEGRFQLSDPIAKYLPEFSNLKVLRKPDGPLDDQVPPNRAPTIEDLLRHTSGFTHGLDSSDPYDAQYIAANISGPEITLAEEMARLSRIPLKVQPGTTWIYSLAPDIEARLVEVFSGLPFDAELDKQIFKPLDLKDTTFRLTTEQANRLAAVHWFKDGKLTIWDNAHGHPSTFGNEPWSGISEPTKHVYVKGSLGLYSTAEDYWRFAQMLANDGRLDDVRLLSPAVVSFMARDHLGTLDRSQLRDIAPGLGFGLGLGVVMDPVAAEYLDSDGSVFWDGAASTLWWADPKRDIVVVAMTQFIGEKGNDLSVLRPQLRALVSSALTDR